MNVLVTGGCGYIGSHTVVELLNAGHRVVIVDNLSNSRKAVLARIAEITRLSCDFVHCDITDKSALISVFQQYDIDAVMHFAGLKSVSESIAKPLDYYHHNVTGAQVLLQCMLQAEVHNLVFSSSATVYGSNNTIPYDESTELTGATSVYGNTKQMIEQMITDMTYANAEFKALSLRYFNPIGAHESGLLGEWPTQPSHNVMPAICEAVKQQKAFTIYGNDYNTQDGTCRRDYIHVMDVAKGHVDALHWLSKKSPDCKAHEQINLGTGVPVSVLELVNAFAHDNGVQIRIEYKNARAGDLAQFWADPAKAKALLGWHSTKDLSDMVKDAWRWALNMPDIQ